MKSLVLAREEFVASDNHEPFLWNMRVWVSPGVLATYKSWRAGLAMPVGTVIVAEHHERRGSLQGPYYVAEKVTTDRWQYSAATSDGWLLEPTNACGLCHSEAIADFVFGLHSLASPGPDTKRPDGE